MCFPAINKAVSLRIVGIVDAVPYFSGPKIENYRHTYKKYAYVF